MPVVFCFFFYFFLGMGALQHSTCLSRQGTRSKVAIFSTQLIGIPAHSLTHSCVLGGASPPTEGEIKAVGLGKHVVYECFPLSPPLVWLIVPVPAVFGVVAAC